MEEAAGTKLVDPRSRPPAQPLGFNSNPIVNCSTDSLFAAEVSLRGLDRHMTEKELNLLQFAACSVAELRFVFDDRIVPKLFDVCSIPGVRALESWDSIKRLLEELSNLFVEARYFHDLIIPASECAVVSPSPAAVRLTAKIIATGTSSLGKSPAPHKRSAVRSSAECRETGSNSHEREVV
jgi:hypothetical protein